MSEGEVVCVTGGSGYIGASLVHLLLHRGYTVRATVKNLGLLPSPFHPHSPLTITNLYYSILIFRG